MKILAKLYIFLTLMLLVSCTNDNKVEGVLSGNVLVLSSGDEIHLINVSNSRNNYDYLCMHVLWQEVIILEQSRELVNGINIIHAFAYTKDSDCLNDMLEKEMPVSSPIPEEPRGISPTDIEVPKPISTETTFTDLEWSKPNIKSTKDVSSIYTYVINVFSKYGIDYMPHIPVLIVDKEQMYRESGSKRTVGLAYTQEYSDGEKSFEIHMIAGLTRLDFAEVLAHEIMHTWLNQNNIKTSTKAEEEGLCNYASYIILTEVGNDYANRLIKAMLNNPDPIYGEGFRTVKKEIERIGLHEYLQNLYIN